ncbi:D-tagatose-bisphosphate aldolase, class II, non-catalytic subunit [Salinisphaera sp.]|uniref:D-tagatose-bisphosphate aldolase, class II, non-catalytic subunit n=1 Tax=Salinisphaera sp. TaxID=1914330 RepID=UPI002D77EE5D|nr:D-tagatose-bisphosphate aldolase, class II, non-catalytic subunit [Salinisphaera sp.]HET7312989.1 D-tagatose-bisphosphate aldolase, class II, non-catalytic subunit [Salinisphaera sp.]
MKKLLARNRAGRPVGICSICSAHPLVIEAALRFDRNTDREVLIEATCNQVNQEGGYTGMTPVDFRAFVEDIAARVSFDTRRLILGGDHLGPNPWKHEPAEAAMDKAEALVEAYAAAGFSKLHLDASMALAGDEEPLAAVTVAERAARLAAAAERRAPVPARLAYVIGTEVPVPGGESDGLDQVAVTRPARVAETVDTHRAAFAARGLDDAFSRVVAVVVQPGVDFDHSSTIAYDPAQASALVDAIDDYDGLVFEAHSTDYQARGALAALVADHFAILKVGPALTFALREGLFALAAIEDELLPAECRSDLRAVIEAVMGAEPDAWRGYYQGDEQRLAVLRAFSFSDRIRYYWQHPRVARAVDRLFDNLEGLHVPAALWRQYAGHEFARLGATHMAAGDVVIDKITQVLEDYRHACDLP